MSGIDWSASHLCRCFSLMFPDLLQYFSDPFPCSLGCCGGVSFQAAIAVLMVVMGFVTYFLVPLAFVTSNFVLFLSILSAILLGMLLGLTLISQSLQVAWKWANVSRRVATCVAVTVLPSCPSCIRACSCHGPLSQAVLVSSVS